MLKPHRIRRGQVVSQLIESLEPRQLLASVLLDVRQLGTAFGAGKSVSVAENGTFTLGVYLHNIQAAATTDASANNGLGAFSISLKSFNEKMKSGTNAWPVSPTASDTVVNATASTNNQSSTPFDFGYSNGVIQDLPLSGDPDTDKDAYSVSGAQLDGGAAFQPGIGVGTDVLLATVTYKASDLNDASRPFNRSVQINTFFTTATAPYGGAMIKGLINNKTDSTNGVGVKNLIASPGNIGSPVTVTVTGQIATTATINGKVYEDKNVNSAIDSGEPGVSGVTIFIDADKDGVLDSTEKKTTTDASGNYTFSGLAAGTYRVREVKPANYKILNPSSSYFDVAVSGSAVVTKNFANAKTTAGGISGNVFNDTDGNGLKNGTETGRSGVKVYLDLDKDGVFDAAEPTKTTDSSGNYSFTNLAGDKTYRVRIVGVSGLRISNPTTGYYDQTVYGQTYTGKNFGLTPKVLISGQVWNDADGDGIKDSGEVGLSSWKVFIDKDNDGVLDAGETSVLTDSAGNYKFTSLAAGAYRVRVVQQAGWTRKAPSTGVYNVTLAAGGSSTGKNFGEKKA